MEVSGHSQALNNISHSWAALGICNLVNTNIQMDNASQPQELSSDPYDLSVGLKGFDLTQCLKSAFGLSLSGNK